MDAGESERICEWMEARPELPNDARLLWLPSPGGWWRLLPVKGRGMHWYFKTLGLDELHEVEKRLTREQWARYRDLLIDDCETISEMYFGCGLINASTEQKVRALAVVAGEADKP